jgi:hypothetical protein
LVSPVCSLIEKQTQPPKTRKIFLQYLSNIPTISL